MRLLANVVGKDMGSVTGRNLLHLKEVFNLDPWTQEDVLWVQCSRGGQLEAALVAEAAGTAQGHGGL